MKKQNEILQLMSFFCKFAPKYVMQIFKLFNILK